MPSVLAEVHRHMHGSAFTPGRRQIHLRVLHPHTPTGCMCAVMNLIRVHLSPEGAVAAGKTREAVLRDTYNQV